MGNSVGIVGGGAAGMMAAITAAKQGAKVTLMEGNDRLGKKLLSTGNGKCNLGNEKVCMEEYYTSQSKLLENLLKRFGTAETITFFQNIGLMIKSKKGYLYPAAEQAAIVQEALRYEVRELGVNVITDCKVAQIWKKSDSPQIHLRGNGIHFQFDRVILACGSQAAPKTGSDGSGYRLAAQLGHTLVPVVPALVQLRCGEDYFKSVAGVRAEASLFVYWREECIAQERGELQLTDYGISGIPVFQISRIVNYLLAGEEHLARGNQHDRGEEKKLSKEGYLMAKMPSKEKVPSKEKGPSKEKALSMEKMSSIEKEVEIAIDFLPDYTMEDMERLVAGRDSLRGQRTVEEFFTGILHKKLMLLFIKLAGLKPGSPAAEADRKKLEQVYKYCRQWRVHVTGSNSYENAQVCAGGVPLDEVTYDLESRKVPGVYFAGEILDVDGKCGGYNLQWAWCSGYLAGSAASSVV